MTVIIKMLRGTHVNVVFAVSCLLIEYVELSQVKFYLRSIHIGPSYLRTDKWAVCEYHSYRRSGVARECYVNCNMKGAVASAGRMETIKTRYFSCSTCGWVVITQLKYIARSLGFC